MILTLLFNLAFSYPVPEYMKDVVITVKTKDGKEYLFSGNTHKVVTRGSERMIPFNRAVDAQIALYELMVAKGRHKHIVSGELVYSMSGMKTEQRPGYMKAETEYDLGLGVEYQYNFFNDLYMDGRIDSNTGTAVNVGIGFK